jgi:hypothetical protein
LYPHDVMANTFASFISTTIPAGLRKLATHTVLTRLLKPRSLLRQCGKQNNFTVTRVRKTSGGVAQLVALPQGPPEDTSGLGPSKTWIKVKNPKAPVLHP